MSERHVIRSAAVLGAGTMGAQLAAHLTNAGLPTLLLDVDSATAQAGFERLLGTTPDPFFTPDCAARISVGSFDTDFERIGRCDWIIEAVVEQLDSKRALLERVDAHRADGSIVSSNTSGLSIRAMAEGRSKEFRRHWLGTHFFNPPRYLPLLELIPTADTSAAVIAAIRRFADLRLGKGVVIARDTPSFIANRIGLYGAARALEALASGGYTIEEIDAMTGPAIGRPKSATFRTIDLSGIDILLHVAENLRAHLDDEAEREAFVLPAFVADLVARGALGDKTRRGFYKKQRGSSGSEILTLDVESLEYRPRQPAALGPLDAARAIEDPGARIRTLFLGDDRVGAFLRRTLGATLLYAARVAPDMAESIDDVDRALRWGYGWALGPFELCDAIGVSRLLAARDVTDPPPLLRDALQRSADAAAATLRDGPLPPADQDLQILRSARQRAGVVKQNAGASLLDLGDGVLALEFHSKLNVIGSDTVEMIRAGIDEASARFDALIIGSDARDFSAGANLLLLLLEAEEGNWDEVDLMVRSFQAATIGLQRAPVPVVVAPAGLALGGGCEVLLHGDAVQAGAESYIGLVEAGVGLIPAGGGTKEMVARASTAAGTDADPLPAVQEVFQTIGFGKVSTSAPDAWQLGYLRERDRVTMNRDRVMTDAKSRALALVRAGYQAPLPRTIRVGGEGVGAALKLGVHLAHRAGRISDHDALIGRKLAGILSGGALPHATAVAEQYLLDLEREAFLSLCGEAKTLARIRHTLKTGKPLRN